MPLIDDEGNLFGLVNVVDALAVLLVLAVVTAGAAFVLQPDAEPTEPDFATTHATLDLGTQPDYLVAQLNEGDTYSPDGTAELTVTDVHIQPQQGANGTNALLRVELRGETADTDDTQSNAISYDGAPPRLGRTLELVTDTYEVSGTITALGDGQAIPTAERQVLLSTTVDAETASSIQAGDAFTLRERTLGTVESVHVYGTANPDRKRVLLGLTLQARETGDGATFAGTILRPNASIPFRTSDYALTGELERVGATEPRGEEATRTVTLRLTDVPQELATSIQSGMTETASGETLARLTNVERESATVVLTSDDGNIYEREHPTKQDLTVTADLSVRETSTGLTFKGRTIQQGNTVVLDLGSITVEATVVST
ncbi:DUF4330 family protein [Halorarum halophilum]|uniref:DUF4330 family protein n=1 Tax=Halorarum halophilum TaxID=2743090 RepID=A0A7D5K930_9EURY|nr:DUF4330 family protein [Halobaculum halophilum]QLG28674.1 DUF4330 family protein [Halobaculum halophilum]